MPGAAVVGAALNGGAIRPYGLFVGGLDVRPNVPLNYAITVVEAGPGEVSSIGFTIEDTDGTIPIPAAGSEIRLQDLILDYPIFSGYLNTCQVEPYPAVGKLMTIDGTGLEALIDWAKLPATDLGGSDISPPTLRFTLAWLAQQNPQVNLIAPEPPSAGPIDGDATWPIGILNSPAALKIWATGGPYVTPLGSLRGALVYAGRNSWSGSFLVVGFYADMVVTVDFYRRLRIFRRGHAPADYTDLTVNDVASGTYVASNLQWIVAPGEVVRSVYVQGAPGVAAWFNDGTGIFGPQETISDPTATEVSRLTKTATDYLAAQAALVRGTLTLEGYVPTVGTIHPGSSLIITDANLGLAAASYQIFRITKTFRAGGRQDWRIDFGNSRPTYVQRVQKAYGKALAWSTNQ